MLNNNEDKNISFDTHKKVKKLIVIGVTVILIVVAVSLFIINLDNDGEKKENKTNNSTTKVTENNNDGDNDSLILNNLKLNSSANEIKDKKYFIYKIDIGLEVNYDILPESENKPTSSYKLFSEYTCKDNCTFRGSYFVHEDGSLEYFDITKGKVVKLDLVKKYATIDKDLVIEKYKAGSDLFFYSKYKGDDSLSIIEDNKALNLVFEDLGLNILSSVELIENGTYMLAKFDGTETLEYELYTNKVKKLGYNKEKIEDYYCLLDLEKKNDFYIVNISVLEANYVLILNQKADKVVGYDDYASKCTLDQDTWYCYLNDFFTTDELSGKLAKYDESGKETIIKKYNAIVGMNKDHIAMAMSKDNYFEVFDVDNNKVLYKFDKLTDGQEHWYQDFFDYHNYYDEKTSTFYAYVKDANLTKEDFPNENHDPEKDDYVNVFGYEYTYNVKTGEGKVIKKATYTQQE